MNCSSAFRLTVWAWLSLTLAALSGCKPPADSASTPASSPAAGATSGGKKLKIAFVSNGVDPFWNIAAAGVKAAGEKLGVETQTLMPPGGIGDQKNMLEDLVTRGIDGISVSPIDPANQTELLNQVAKRAKLATADSDAPNSDRLVYIGMDNYLAGRACGELVKEALPKGGSVMIFVGRMEQDNAKRRRQGTIDLLLGRPVNPSNFDAPGQVLEGNGFKILGTLTDQFDRAKGKANVEDTLAKYPNIDAMVGLFAYNPPLILEALGQAGKLGKIKVIAFDEDKATLEGIRQGHVHGTVVQNPYMYGYKSVEILTEVLRGNSSGVPPTKVIDISGRKIQKGNVDEFWADLKSKTGATK